MLEYFKYCKGFSPAMPSGINYTGTEQLSGNSNK